MCIYALMYVCIYIYPILIHIGMIYEPYRHFLSHFLYALMKIPTEVIVVILITDMYWVFTNHEFCPVISIVCRYVFISESGNSYLSIAPGYE